jgi:hypothetical protein
MLLFLGTGVTAQGAAEESTLPNTPKRSTHFFSRADIFFQRSGFFARFDRSFFARFDRSFFVRFFGRFSSHHYFARFFIPLAGGCAQGAGCKFFHAPGASTFARNAADASSARRIRENGMTWKTGTVVPSGALNQSTGYFYLVRNPKDDDDPMSNANFFTSGSLSDLGYPTSCFVMNTSQCNNYMRANLVADPNHSRHLLLSSSDPALAALCAKQMAAVNCSLVITDDPAIGGLYVQDSLASFFTRTTITVIVAAAVICWVLPCLWRRRNRLRRGKKTTHSRESNIAADSYVELSNAAPAQQLRQPVLGQQNMGRVLVGAPAPVARQPLAQNMPATGTYQPPQGPMPVQALVVGAGVPY